MEAIVGGVEAGGTKFLLGVRRGGAVLAQARVDTRDPDATMRDVARFFEAARAEHGQPAAVGLATFGPVELDPANARYGRIVDTPKPGWDGFDIRGALAAATAAPVAIETDVNAAAWAEGLRGACRGLERHCYVTVGTGIGVGFVEDGHPARAFPHPEAGHLRVGRAAGDDFPGLCPYHGDCLEGLACGPAMTARWGASGSQLPAGHAAWDFEAHYIAALCVNLSYAYRPQRIILGGGVFNAAHLMGHVRSAFTALLGGYAPGPHAASPLTYLAPPALVDPSPGLEGAFLLGERLAATGC